VGKKTPVSSDTIFHQVKNLCSCSSHSFSRNIIALESKAQELESKALELESEAASLEDFIE
jgi:hypothetical protein